LEPQNIKNNEILAFSYGYSAYLYQCQFLKTLKRNKSWEKRVIPRKKDAFLERGQFPGGLSAKKERN
jgi:hypothetical protein